MLLYSYMNNKLEGFLSRVKQGVGLETPTPILFAKKIRQSSEHIVELVGYLKKDDVDTKLSDINSHWSDQGHNPYANADMGFSNANDMINPKNAIFEEIEGIKKKIENLRTKMEKDEKARRIVGAWETILFDRDFTQLALTELPKLFNDFASRLEEQN